MRNFEERKAEVFRRSKERIEERKRNRKRIFMMCMPICLLLTVGGIAIFPQVFGGNNKFSYMSENIYSDEGVGGIEITGNLFVQVDITGRGKPLQSGVFKEDAKEIGEFYYSIHSMFLKAEEDEKFSESSRVEDDGLVDSGKEDPEENIEENTSQNAETVCNYMIVFTTKDHARVVYSLEGSILINQTTKTEIVLTKEQQLQFWEAVEDIFGEECE